jgi:hypothetical protein
MLEDSLRKLGAGRSVLVDREGRVIAGNKTVETARKLGLTKIAVIETDGETLVAVRRGDIDLRTDKRAVELAVADNRVAEIDLDWNAEVLAALDIDLSQFWDEQELVALMAGTQGAPLSSEEAHRSLVERFGVPPFSVLDARQGYWQDRKRAWIALGIKSELGRGGEGNLLGLEPAEQARARWKSSLGGSPRPPNCRSGRTYDGARSERRAHDGVALGAALTIGVAVKPSGPFTHFMPHYPVLGLH